jgi:isopentenyl phosphate kinase
VDNLLFLKLGGSLITDKNSPRTVRQDVLERICQEIHTAMQEDPGLKMIIGHGSGSFGHMAAKKYNTTQGVYSPFDWTGFAEVWHEARSLNQIVIESLFAAGVPVIAFPPSALSLTIHGQPADWDLRTLQAALDARLIPVVNGDVTFDTELGGTILSTEDVFVHLAKRLHPRRILLAGIEPGVWADFPNCTRLIADITPANYADVGNAIQGSISVDVTGGMMSKVNNMLKLAMQIPGLDIIIFSGNQPGMLPQALRNNIIGTRIHNGQ